jgi:transmembrane sensor
MLEHRSEVTAAGGQRLELAEGQGARFGPQGVVPDTLAPQTASAWRRGLLEAHDLPLGEVIDALRACRTGFVRIAPRAAALRVYGSYDLDDTDRALAALAETLPIEVRVFRQGWLVTIE